jgi:hypothetical protein
MSAGSPAYVELDAMTAFSFLEGGSHPHEMVVQAMAVGHAALGVADRNTLAGVVRAHVEAKKHGFKLLVGCRLVFRDGAALIVYPRDRAAYGRLCRLLSLGKSRIEASEAPSSSLSQTGRGTADRGGGAARDARKTQPPPFARLRRAPPPALRAYSPIGDGGDERSQLRQSRFEPAHILRRRRLEAQRFAGDRVDEAEHGRVQRLARQPRLRHRRAHRRRRLA